MRNFKKENYPLFIESLANHQRLVDILSQHKDANGITTLSQPEIARLVKRSQSWVTQAIRRINTEDICIEILAPGKYILNYTDLLEQGVFAEIMSLILECYSSPTMFYERDSIMASSRGLRLKTIQMFKAYSRTKRYVLCDNEIFGCINQVTDHKV